MDQPFFDLSEGDTPLVAAAVHDGHVVRPELTAHFALGDLERLREEDPFTGAWTEVASTRIIGRRSRFEVDLNRPPEKAVYLKPEDAWGLQVWKGDLPDDIARRSRVQYDDFYTRMHELFSRMTERFGRFIVYDLHTYNHRRDGATADPADPAGNPEVNIGTGTLDRARWGAIAERFVADLSGGDFLGRHLDVRENVKFQGGHFSRWAHENFPDSACVLAIEFKKFFMDEWTGEPDRAQVAAIRQALAATVPGALEELKRL